MACRRPFLPEGKSPCLCKGAFALVPFVDRPPPNHLIFGEGLTRVFLAPPLLVVLALLLHEPAMQLVIIWIRLPGMLLPPCYQAGLFAPRGAPRPFDFGLHAASSSSSGSGSTVHGANLSAARR